MAIVVGEVVRTMTEHSPVVLCFFLADIRKAVAFGYFEALLHSTDLNRALAEVARLKSLNNLLDSVGYDRIIYEDFVDETLAMLQLIPTLPTNDDGTALLEALERPGVWDAIIAHFRVGARHWSHSPPRRPH